MDILVVRACHISPDALAAERQNVNQVTLPETAYFD
jgi:hypothetical protein